jgi:hypothetical protein
MAHGFCEVTRAGRMAIGVGVLALIVGCSGVVRLMPRDSGKVYSGKVQGSLGGSGTMTVSIDGEDFTGPIVQTSSNEGFALIQQYGRGSRTCDIGATPWDVRGLPHHRCTISRSGPG